MINRSLILDTLVGLVVRTALALSIFLLFSGHNAPGGGFVGGLVAGITLVLGFLADGRAGVLSILRTRPENLLGIGLGLALLTAIMGGVWGSSFLESAKLEIDLPILGTLKTTSALPFDIGVFAVVVGLVGVLLLAVGDDGSEEEQ